MKIRKIDFLKLRDFKFLLLAMVFIAVPFKLNFSNLFLIIAFVFSLYEVLIKKEKLRIFNFYFIFPLLFFLIVFLSAMFSNNQTEGLTEVNKNLLLIIIPVVLVVLLRHTRVINKLLLFFTVSTIFCTLILLIFNIIKSLSGDPVEMLFFHEFTKPYDEHPVYFSLKLALSTFIFNDIYFKKTFKLKFKPHFFIGGSIVLFLGVFFCASKIIMVLFTIMYLIQLSVLIKSLNVKLVLVFSFLFATLLALNNDIIQSRLNDGVRIKSYSFQPTNNLSQAKIFSYEEKKQISDLDLRIIFAKIGFFHLINDNKLITGYGVGDVQNHLDYYFMTYGLAPNWYEGYNFHNQYLQILASYGLPVLILFLIYLFLSLCAAIKSKSSIYIYFIFLVSIAFIFESYLVRNKGILFFYLFNTLFLIEYYNNKLRIF